MIVVDREKFVNYLKQKQLKYLSIKNIISQINKMQRTISKISQIPSFLLQNPIPIRKVAIYHYINYLESQGIKVSEEVKKMIRGIKLKTERKEMETLTFSQGKKLVDWLIENNELELAIICMICYDTGARIRAVLKLRKKDIEVTEEGVYLMLFEKRGKVLRRLITTSTFQMLSQLFNLQNLSDYTYLFFNKDRISEEELQNKYWKLWDKLTRISEELFGQRVSFHWLRRGSAVEIYRASGKDLITTSEFLGHEDTSFTKRYLKIQAGLSEEIVKKRKWD